MFIPKFGPFSPRVTSLKHKFINVNCVELTKRCEMTQDDSNSHLLEVQYMVKAVGYTWKSLNQTRSLIWHSLLYHKQYCKVTC